MRATRVPDADRILSGCIVAVAYLYIGVYRDRRGVALPLGFAAGFDLVFGLDLQPFEDSVEGGAGHVGLARRGADVALRFVYEMFDVASLEPLDGAPLRFLVRGSEFAPAISRPPASQ